MTIDPLSDLRLSNPVRDVAPYDDERAQALLDRAVTRAGVAPARRRRALLTVGSLAAAVVAGGGGLAYAVFGQPAETALKINCSAATDRAEFDAQGGFTAVLDAATGDPIADCAAEYERLQGHAPDLRAYETGESSVTVMPAEWPAPPQWVPLSPGFVSDTVRLELKQRLDDLVDGTPSRCLTADEAERVARTQLADLGLAGWRFERLAAASRADGDDWCALAWPDETGAQKILIQGVEGLVDDDAPVDPLRSVAADLRRSVSEQCVTLEDARRAAESALARHGYDLTEAKITAVIDPESRCSRVDLVPGGLITIVLRGPTTGR